MTKCLIILSVAGSVLQISYVFWDCLSFGSGFHLLMLRACIFGLVQFCKNTIKKITDWLIVLIRGAEISVFWFLFFWINGSFKRKVRALACVHWRACIRVRALACVGWPACVGVRALTCVQWRACVGVRALAYVRWCACVGFRALACVGVGWRALACVGVRCRELRALT